MSKSDKSILMNSPIRDGTAEAKISVPGFWDYHGLARDGIVLLLNNGFEESKKLFRCHRYGQS